MINKLPGCITITNGPEEATEADIVCGAGTAQPSVNQAVSGAKDSGAVAATDNTVASGSSSGSSAAGSTTSALVSSVASSDTFSSAAAPNKVALVKPAGSASVSGSSPSVSAIPLASANSTTAAASISGTASVINMVNGYVTMGCYTELKSGKRALNGTHYTDAKNMDVDSCTAYCSKKGFQLAGVEYAQE